MPSMSPTRHALLAEFDRVERELPGASRSWSATRRREACERFAALGFPSTELEDWRFTNVAAISAIPWETATPTSQQTATELSPILGRPTLNGSDAVELVFVDGHFAPSLSHLFGLPEGVKLDSLARALGDDLGASRTDSLESSLGRVAGDSEHAFVALNTALFRDGCVVEIANGVVFPRPIHLLFVSTARAGATPLASHPRNLVVLGAYAQATVVETHIGPDGVRLNNPVTEIVLGEGAVLDHLRLQDEGRGTFHIATVAARLARSASLHSMSFALGAALSRIEITATQAGPGTNLSLDGLYLIDGDQHSDNRTNVDHAEPHGSSTQLYKGILGGQSHGVFNGRIHVREGAQKTDSRLTNRNLLLTADARIDTKPELLIFADDVKCGHGATIGQLDENAVFYLRSRGLDSSAARSLLTWAFASEVVQRIPVEAFRAHVRALLLERLPGGAEFMEAV